MPRPSKHVSPTTLGGKIREARETLGLSLADVAGDTYSTSLISQIERNRVDPSEESLSFLATKLQLSYADLLVLKNQTPEISQTNLKTLNETYDEASSHLSASETQETLDLLKDIVIPSLPMFIKWKFAVLKGKALYQLGKLIEAQQLLSYANIELEAVPVGDADQSETILLSLTLGDIYLDMGFKDASINYYRTALERATIQTQLGTIIVLHEKLGELEKKQEALDHLTIASSLAKSISDQETVERIQEKIQQKQKTEE